MKKGLVGSVAAGLVVCSGWGSDGTDSLKVTASYAEKLVSVSETGYKVVGGGSVGLTVSYGTRFLVATNLEGWGPWTVAVSFGDQHVFEETIRSASRVDFVNRTIYWTNNAGVMSLSWSTNRMTLFAMVNADLLNVGALGGSTDAAVQKSVQVSIVVFDNMDLQRTVNLRGTSSARTVARGSGTGARKFTLTSVRVAGDADVSGPKVTFTKPAANLTVTKGDEIEISGTATDGSGVSEVGYCVTSSLDDSPVPSSDGPFDWMPFDQATGVWRSSFSPRPGTNYIYIKAQDAVGNESGFAKRIVLYRQTCPVSIDVSGNGSVSGVTNGQLLEIGRNYSITAKPAPGQTFVAWAANGMSFSSVNPSSFKMTEGLSLTARFQTNPFPALKGTYSGLFFNHDNAIDPANAGAFIITVSSNGAYSAKLSLLSHPATFSGRLHFNLNDQRRLHAGFDLSPAPDSRSGFLEFDLEGEGQVTGTFYRFNESWLTHEYSESSVEGQRCRGATNQASQRYNVVFQTSSATLEGYGYGSATLAGSGVVTLGLNLPDKTPLLTVGSSICADGAIPFFAPLYGRKGLVLGWLVMVDYYRYTSFNVVGRNIKWLKPATSLSDSYYTNAFSLSLSAGGVPYVPPRGATNLMGWTNGMVGFMNWALEETSVAGLTYDPVKTSFTFGAGNNFPKNRLTLAPSTGLVTGSFVSSDGVKLMKFQGIFLPNLGAAYGFYSEDGLTGGMCLQHLTADGQFDFFEGVDSGWHPGNGGSAGASINAGFMYYR